MKGKVLECREYVGGSLTLEEKAWKNVKKLFIPDRNVLIKLGNPWMSYLRKEKNSGLSVVEKPEILVIEMETANLLKEIEIPDVFLAKVKEYLDIESEFSRNFGEMLNTAMRKICATISGQKDLISSPTEVNYGELYKAQNELVNLARETGILKELVN